MASKSYFETVANEGIDAILWFFDHLFQVFVVPVFIVGLVVRAVKRLHAN